MPYNKKLYASSDSVIDSSVIYDDTQTKLQNEINADVASDIVDLNETLATYTRPNLLDNWYFVGGGSQLGDGVYPINQRGQSSYSGDKSKIIDRWVLNGAATVTLLSSGMSVGAASTFHGVLEALKNGTNRLSGQTVTLSALVSSISGSGNATLQISHASAGNIIGTNIASKSFSEAGLVTLTTVVPSNLSDTYLNVSVNAANGNNIGFTLQAIKLEIGATQTLAHLENGSWVLNELPDFAEELSKCNQIFRRKLTVSAALSVGTIASLTDAMINADTVCDDWHIDNTAVQTSAWTVITSDTAPQLIVSGTSSGTTAITLTLRQTKDI